MTVQAKALCQVALRIQIDQECTDPHLGKTKSIRRGDRALPGPPFKVEEELFSDGWDEGRKSQVGAVFADVLRLIVTFLIGIPLRRGKDSFCLLLEKFVFRNPEDLGNGHRRVDPVS